MMMEAVTNRSARVTAAYCTREVVFESVALRPRESLSKSSAAAHFLRERTLPACRRHGDTYGTFPRFSTPRATARRIELRNPTRERERLKARYVVPERVRELVLRQGVRGDVLAPRGLGLLAALVLRAAALEVEALALARLVGEHEAGVVVQRRAAEAAGEDADRRQDEPRADLDERRAVLALRWNEEVSGSRDATNDETEGRAVG